MFFFELFLQPFFSFVLFDRLKIWTQNRIYQLKEYQTMIDYRDGKSIPNFGSFSLFRCPPFLFPWKLSVSLFVRAHIEVRQNGTALKTNKRGWNEL